MSDFNEEEPTSIFIDFTKFSENSDNLQEADWWGLSQTPTMMGIQVNYILKRMFGMNSIPVTIKGTSGQIESFAKTLGKEKRYIQTARALGLDDARTLKTKADVERAAKEFKRQTGIDWPYK